MLLLLFLMLSSLLLVLLVLSSLLLVVRVLVRVLPLPLPLLPMRVPPHVADTRHRLFTTSTGVGPGQWNALEYSENDKALPDMLT